MNEPRQCIYGLNLLTGMTFREARFRAVVVSDKRRITKVRLVYEDAVKELEKLIENHPDCTDAFIHPIKDVYRVSVVAHYPDGTSKIKSADLLSYDKAVAKLKSLKRLYDTKDRRLVENRGLNNGH